MRILTPDQAAAIAESRAARHETSRPTSPGAEAVMHEMLPVLDHGFVRLVDYMGDDGSAPQSARMSYGRGTRALSDDTALIRYLMRHHHSTPFEMAQVKLHVCLPVFVARQWMRHRTGAFNEYSARYSIMEREFYVPEPEHLAAQSRTNRQGRAQALEGEEARTVLRLLKEDAARAYDDYAWMINEGEDGQPLDPERDGLARELARINLPVSVYTQFYWTVNLWNLMRFIKLRADAHAQYEIRVYADTIASKIVQPWVPASFQAFDDFSMNAVTLSAQAVEAVRAVLAAAQTGAKADIAAFGMSKREIDEVMASLPEMRALL